MSHELTDVFRERVQYAQIWKDKLFQARSIVSEKRALDHILRIEAELGDLKTVEAGILADLMLSYRDVSAWQQMVDLYDKMPADIREAVMIRQQYALALNRIKQHEKAVSICENILREFGGSAET